MQNKKIIIIGIFVVVAFLGAILINGLLKNGVFGGNSSSFNDQVIKTEVINVNDVPEVDGIKTTKKSTSLFVVEIKGEVLYPGVYEFESDEVLVQDVIAIAGGLTKRADTSLINLASLVLNHSSITIGSKDEKSYVLREGEDIPKININTCTKEELESLDGIGEAKAIEIINYRKINGYFRSIEDLKQVNGIGDVVYQKIKDYITV